MFILLPSLYSCKADSVFVFLDDSKQIYPEIIIPEHANTEELKAANVLQAAFKLVTGNLIKIMKESSTKTSESNKRSIYIGKTKKSSSIIQIIKAQEYLIQSIDNNIVIAGGAEDGLIFGVYTFIENFLHQRKFDERPSFATKPAQFDIPTQYKEVGKPAFLFRQVFFPSSNKEEYQHWHRVHHLDNLWGCWGHNLPKLLKTARVNLPTSAYALVQGQRNEEQYCFTNQALFQGIKKAIEFQLSQGQTAKYWSISANDNALICSCDACKKVNINQGASASVIQLVNQLAGEFPQLVFVTLAYATTLQAPQQSKMKSNTAVMLSTIDYPKGIPLEQQKGFNKFETNLNNWQKVCPQIMIWDYPIQYTNYFDVFPNMPALQSDLAYFKRKGIVGVFEQGSEYEYSIFQEWKNYAIAKCLWNPAINLVEVRSDFFESFYGDYGHEIEQFYQQCENNLMENKASLDIYGNVKMSEKSYLKYDQLEAVLIGLRKKLLLEKEMDKNIYYNIHKLTACLEMLMLQFEQSKGIHPQGYATALNETSWDMKTDILANVDKLKRWMQANEIVYLNEIHDSVDTYLNDYKQFFQQSKTSNLIWNHVPSFNTQFDPSYPANYEKTLTDGLYGGRDYSLNWLIFNNTPMDVLFSDLQFTRNPNLTIRFLHDPKHFIFLPKSIQIFGGANATQMSLIENKRTIESNDKSPKPETIEFQLPKDIHYLRIIATYGTDLPVWQYHPSKKPSIACDEINIQYHE